MTNEKVHSRATGAIRLLLAVWLIFAAVRTMADPHQAVADQGLPMGIQIVARNHAELACLQLAFAYDEATRWSARRLPPLIA